MTAERSLKTKIATVVHNQWAHWMRNLFSVSKMNQDGSVTIPARKVKRWNRQMITPYFKLSKKEQECDDLLAERYLTEFMLHGTGQTGRDVRTKLKKVDEMTKYLGEMVDITESHQSVTQASTSPNSWCSNCFHQRRWSDGKPYCEVKSVSYKKYLEIYPGACKYWREEEADVD